MGSNQVFANLCSYASCAIEDHDAQMLTCYICLQKSYHDRCYELADAKKLEEGGVLKLICEQCFVNTMEPNGSGGVGYLTSSSSRQKENRESNLASESPSHQTSELYDESDAYFDNAARSLMQEKFGWFFDGSSDDRLGSVASQLPWRIYDTNYTFDQGDAESSLITMHPQELCQSHASLLADKIKKLRTKMQVYHRVFVCFVGKCRHLAKSGKHPQLQFLLQMEPLYEYTRQCQFEEREANEDELIQKLSSGLDNAGDIDFIFPQKDSYYGACLGTILHYSILHGYDRVVAYALSRGADIRKNITWKENESSFCTALEASFKSTLAIFEIVKKRCLELYSGYNLTALHFDCAFRGWVLETEPYVEIGQINATVSTESPLWPGMTPILIAAKFENEDLAKRLLDRGADPIVKDPEGDTPLHYFAYSDFYDERLFAFDAVNTFGFCDGQSHFHLACGRCPEALHIVKRYLDQGISPDLPTQSLGYDNGRVGLHIASKVMCPELVQLLLEYGADIEKQDSRGDSPIKYFFEVWDDDEETPIRCLGLFIENGSNMEKVDLTLLPSNLLNNVNIPGKQVFLCCIKKLTLLNKDFVSAKLNNVYLEVLKEFDDWNEAEYADHWSKELRTLSHLGLRRILDDTIIVKDDFKHKFGWLDSFAFEDYPIYGCLLKIRTKRKLFEFEGKKRKIAQLVPEILKLFQSVCHLPNLCADMILWNLSCEELNQFVLSLANEV